MEARATDHQGRTWRGNATFTAADDGSVDLRRDAPSTGTYTGVDGMGLFITMAPPAGDLADERFLPEVLGGQPGVHGDRDDPVRAADARRARPAPARLLDPAGVVAVGYSRGSEAALLLADRHPEVVRGVVLYAPNDVAAQGFPDGGHAWTHRGKPVTHVPIAVNRVVDPVLALAGGDDRLWPSLGRPSGSPSGCRPCGS